jgi:Electron transfer flavoprotein domain
MPGILVYALHDDEGNFNKNSLGAISEAAKLAGEIGGEASALVVGDIADDACAGLGNWGAAKVYRAKSVPEGLAQPIVDAMAKVIQGNGISYALFGGGLLGFEIGAGLTARLNAGVTMEVTEVKVQDGKLIAERPILQDSQIADVGYVAEPGIIISRLNAFDAKESGGSATVEDVEVELSPWSTKATMVQRGEQRPRRSRGLQIGRGTGRVDGRRRRRDPRGRRRRLVPVRGPDRSDREDGGAEAVPRRRHLRCDPAQGRDAELGEHPRDQQGSERSDLRVLRPRRGRRPAQDRAEADRGDQSQEGRLSSGSVVIQLERSSRCQQLRRASFRPRLIPPA